MSRGDGGDNPLLKHDDAEVISMGVLAEPPVPVVLNTEFVLANSASDLVSAVTVGAAAVAAVAAAAAAAVVGSGPRGVREGQVRVAGLKARRAVP